MCEVKDCTTDLTKASATPQKKSVYPRADVAQFTVAFYRQFGRNRPRCQNDQTRSPSTHLLSAGYRYRRNESEETKEAQAHQPAVLKMKFRDPGNRVSQAIFRCLSCGHQTNADINAAENIRRQGLEILAKARNISLGVPPETLVVNKRITTRLTTDPRCPQELPLPQE